MGPKVNCKAGKKRVKGPKMKLKDAAQRLAPEK